MNPESPIAIAFLLTFSQGVGPARARTLTQRIGSDYVILRDDQLIVLSRAYMEAWQVRTHRQAVISFDGREWRVIEACAVAPGSIQYTLAPWDRSEQRVGGVTIDYGPSYVAERDRMAGQSRS